MDPLCSGVAGTCTAFAAGTSEQDIQRALVAATPDSTFVFGEGTFSFQNALALVNVAGVTLQGAGRERTVLDFSGQVAGSEGLSAETTSRLRVRDLGLKDPKGDGIKVVGSSDVRFERVRVEWTSPNAAEHGAYGLYPVQCTRVLVQDSYVRGASDAGIYVGQSRDIVVRRNEATGNAVGIEIENSQRADVYENALHGNTGGLLLSSLPLLQVGNARQVRAYRNQIHDNNLANFAAGGNTAALVPAGTGVLVLAHADVELFDNTVSNHHSVAMAVLSYLLTGLELGEPAYDPYARGVYLHDNSFSGNGSAPDTATSLGQMLSPLRSHMPGKRTADVVTDGLVPPGASGANPLELCLGSATASFVNLHADAPDEHGLFTHFDTDVAPYACTRAALPEVSFEGL
ncbi:MULTISPECIES: parallel beta-helix domain-containing protein [Myxococcaceae]|uniref:parallel beta-helix domain-containing protein n=1 Tax=Myxococcaceae TaxID=31 RepID=UPI00188F3917|nr:right-handed parallel beta-helix repeat-containing protein [Simulacricoccus sp. 17bor-14]